MDLPIYSLEHHKHSASLKRTETAHGPTAMAGDVPSRLIVVVMCTSMCLVSLFLWPTVLIARSHSDDSHVNSTVPCMSCTRMHFAQAHPPVSCIPLGQWT